ncbi:sensor domain-containing protein [Nocardiopsis sediminis]|uniref:histidine kinase n=1 Tax=Nocardiopsis sediminis TaxID=1778267 RepID=A0ABV8FYB1_9ACTN
MTDTPPRTPLQALPRARFLLTAWPWRSALYALSTAPVLSLLAFPLLVIALPWVILAVMLIDAGRDGMPDVATSVGLLVSGGVLVGGLGPLTTLPAAMAERLRLRLIDLRPAADGHRDPASPGLWAWLRLRYTEPATWRELAYMALGGLLLPAWMLLWGLPLLTAMLLATPLLAAAEGPVNLGPIVASWPAETWPAVLIGVVLLVATPYLLALVAGAHGALARALLTGRGAEELRVELVEVTRSRARLVDAFESERRRIERDLHDGAQQRLVALTMQLGLARLDLPGDSPAGRAVAAAHDQAKEVIADLRELIHNIHPRVLTDRGLPAALAELADRCPLPVRVRADLAERLPAHIEGSAYFVAAEGLANAVKHSGAESAWVGAHLDGDRLVLEIGDDGRGGADPQRGTGLTGLADRVAVMDGRMLLSSPEGGPTRLRVELPCRQI